jgi:hypothetical protein
MGFVVPIYLPQGLGESPLNQLLVFFFLIFFVLKWQSEALRINIVGLEKMLNAP